MSATMTPAEARQLLDESAEAVDRVWGILEDNGMAAGGYLVNELPVDTEDQAVALANEFLPEIGRLSAELDRLWQQYGGRDA
jgi:hypothetical protein